MASGSPSAWRCTGNCCPSWHSQALTGEDIESGYAQVTELMTTLLRVERGSVWRFDADGTSLECVDVLE